MSAVADKYEELQNLGVEVITISVDSPFVHKAWSDQELSKMAKEIPFHMASDSAGIVGTMYNVYDKKAGVDIRGRYIIDPDGVIQALEILTPAVGRKFDETIRQIQAFQHVRSTQGAEACPASWTPGKKTLKPSADLVGNVWKEWTPKDDL